MIDMLNYLFGDYPTDVTARATTHLDSPVEECCVLVLEYPEDRTGVALISWLASRNIENIVIHGTEPLRVAEILPRGKFHGSS